MNQDRRNGAGGQGPGKRDDVRTEPIGVSVVIPTRNRVQLLAQTLHTVLAQQPSDTQPFTLEVVVVDEASTDDTPRWLAHHPDPRVRTVRHDTPRGLANARNAGIAATSGEWLGFVDDDDLWLPDKLARQLDAARSAGAHWAYGGELVVTDAPSLVHIQRPREETISRIPWANVVPGGGSNAIVSRTALEIVGGFDAGLDIVADWDMWIRLHQFGDPAIVSDPVMAYRLHATNMSRNATAMLAAIQELDGRTRDRRGGAPLDWDTVYHWLGLRALSCGDRRTARRLAWRALRAQHAGAGRRLGRSFMPLSPRAPVADAADAADAKDLRDRVRPRRVLPWPVGTEPWLEDVLAITP